MVVSTTSWEGEGVGYNVDFPLGEHVDGSRYRRTLVQALQRVREYSPRFLVVSLGLDTAKGDPTGSWSLRPDDFEANGELIGKLNLPTLVVQEGGYRTRSIGRCAASFFRGLTRAIQLS